MWGLWARSCRRLNTVGLRQTSNSFYARRGLGGCTKGLLIFDLALLYLVHVLFYFFICL